MSSTSACDADTSNETSDSDSLWYKDAVFYEVRVSSFFDANGDGIGDFQGLEQKLDYLADLGVTVLWLLPFYPSPLRDDGYDIADYTDVHPDMGTMDDFRRFLDAAHRRGLRVVTELVINHTSDRHPWFERARRAPKGSPERDFYVWSDDPQKFREARIIFKDFETSNFSWDAVAGSYYWHRFYSHQPDLNFDNPRVMDAVLEVLDFWFQLGVDGLRLDAIPYLAEREGTNCENLSETHEIIRKIRSHVDEHYQGRMLLAEANQWPEDAASYFGLGDECHMAFHFPIMPRMFMALEMEDRFPLVDILEQTPDIPETCQWALFLRNHDELTLEMVTEEEREYMWHAYASDPSARINLGIRRRLAPLLEGSRARIELLIALLLSLPGTPVLYYGDEIAMGDNMYLGDRNGVRTPMQWSPDRNAGFSRANPQRLRLPVVIDPEYHYEAVNVETQQGNPESLLWWMKRLLALRKQFRAFGRGSIKILTPKNPHIFAFFRRYQDETLLIVVNFSRFTQHVELDLRDYRGMRPLELFGLSRLGVVGRRPYSLTVGPYGYYWLRMSEDERLHSNHRAVVPDWPRLTVNEIWTELLAQHRALLDAALPAFVHSQRWFGGKGRTVTRMNLVEAQPLTPACFIAIFEVAFASEASEQYFLPLGLSTGMTSEFLASRYPEMVIAEVTNGAGEHLGLLHDAAFDREFAVTLCRMMCESGKTETAGCRISAESFEPIQLQNAGASEKDLDVRSLGLQQSNSSVRIGVHYVLKLLRRLEEGTNPDLELGDYLGRVAKFQHVPKVAGAVTLRSGNAREPITLAILQQFVANVGDAWFYTQTEVGRYYRAALTTEHQEQWFLIQYGLLDLVGKQPESRLRALIGPYFDAARLIGQRTAQMHLCLAAATDDPKLVPEPFTTHYQRQLYQGFRSLTGRTLDRLGANIETMPEPISARCRALIGREQEILQIFEEIRDQPISAGRIRIHGDYHLGQLLCTGNDFVIVDFEGEPLRSISERRIKRSPLRDVAGMLRSFHYAAMNSLQREMPGAIVRPADRQSLLPWAELWVKWVSASFLDGYLRAAKAMATLPTSPPVLELLLRVYVLEKALYEIGYELGHRPDWVSIPVDATLRLLDAAASARCSISQPSETAVPDGTE
jgi:maltose alpha-D-glucosyltransferase / alpha-amylase